MLLMKCTPHVIKCRVELCQNLLAVLAPEIGTWVSAFNETDSLTGLCHRLCQGGDDAVRHKHIVVDEKQPLVLRLQPGAVCLQVEKAWLIIPYAGNLAS